MRDGAPGEPQEIRRGGGREKRSFQRREPSIGLRVGREQRLDRGAQLGIRGAKRREPARLAGLIELDQLVEGGLDGLPPVWIHNASQVTGPLTPLLHCGQISDAVCFLRGTMNVRAVSFLLGTVLSAGSLNGQQVSGSIRGRVLEDSTPLAAAQVRVSSPDLLGTRATLTDRDGYYHIHALPPGTYTVHISRIGTRPVIIEGVTVQLGRATSLDPTQMEASAIQLETVRLVANRLSIDPTSTVVGATLTPEDYAVLPGDRDYRYLMEILPNIVQSGRGDQLNANGATGLENSYFVDGMNVTEELRAQWATSLPYNFIKAVEIKTGGYEAQYGKALGAVVNAVTYSGTNDFGFSVFGFATHSALSAEPKAQPTLRESNVLGYDVGVRVGGPIIRDRLWYSAAYNPRIWHSDREITGLGSFRDEHVMHVFAAKASLRASAVTNLELSVFGDPATHHLVEPSFVPGYSPLTADPYRVRFEAGSTVGVLRGTVVLSRFLLEASAARSMGRLNGMGGTETAQNQPLFIDHGANTISGGVGPWSKADLARSSFVVRGTLTSGRHTTVIGAEYEDVSAFRDLGWTGGYLLETVSSGGFRTTSEGAPGTFHNRVPTIYLQNSWRVADALTINTGLRWSAQKLTGASGVVAQRLPNEWQPRLGVIWQPGSSGNDRLYASFGRFYLQEPLNLSSLNYLDYPLVWSFYSTDPRQPGAVPDSVWDLSLPAGAWMKFARIPGLQAENSDEISVGYERLVGTALKLTIRAVHRDLRSSFQWGVDPATGAFYLGTPGEGDFTILPKPVRQYRALELSAEGSWRGLAYRASYVLSRSRGNYPGLFSSDGGFANPGGSAMFFSPEHAVNSTGLLPNDHTHLFKFSGSRRMRFGLTAGVFITVESGSPMNAFGPSPYGWPVFFEPRGSAGRTPWLWDANVRFAQELRPTGRAPVRMLLDVLHLGNPQRPVRLIEEKYQLQVGSGAPVLNPSYRQPLTYQAPMMARVGMEVTF